MNGTHYANHMLSQESYGPSKNERSAQNSLEKGFESNLRDEDVNVTVQTNELKKILEDAIYHLPRGLSDGFHPSRAEQYEGSRYFRDPSYFREQCKSTVPPIQGHAIG